MALTDEGLVDAAKALALGLGTGFVIALLALHGQRMGLEFDREFLLVKSRDSHRDAIGVVAGPLDIVGRIALRLIAKVAIVK